MLSKNRLCALIICIISVVSIALLFGCNPNDLNGNEILSVNKKEYLGGEEIYFSAKGEQEAWIGLYREIDDVSKVEAIRHLDVCKNGFVSGERMHSDVAAPITRVVRLSAIFRAVDISLFYLITVRIIKFYKR